MKLKLTILLFGIIVFTSCKKQECKCTTVYYDANGYYIGSDDDKKYTVSDASECQSHNSSTATEVTNCELDDN